ncbi:hypothetical protein CDAR_23311 [Caerostris darwini]|uniref:Uncharacterized protein n=1 Tax=Caerostris darwini TaxID=1538125 RepID=A0AAV4T925_9ARAC|nr:hypothetical protein CDAR_23311 [Caerostris darwini]
MDPAPVLTEADVCRKITAATQLLTERRKLHDLATQAITKQQILMDAGLVTAKTIKASAATIKKAAEAVSDAENQLQVMLPQLSFSKLFACKTGHKAHVSDECSHYWSYHSKDTEVSRSKRRNGGYRIIRLGCYRDAGLKAPSAQGQAGTSITELSIYHILSYTLKRSDDAYQLPLTTCLIPAIKRPPFSPLPHSFWT